jgi:hypothetical protein
MRFRIRLLFCVMVLVLVSVLGCTAGSGVGVTPTPATYTDPFAYCAAVGTIDRPDARYLGEEVPESVAKGLQKALDASDTPAEILVRGSVWRCMNGQVYGCFVGANLPCEAKADLDRTPTQEVKDYCAENPIAEFIPMYVTGRETVYEWRCTNGAPEIVRQFAEPDERGFISDIWYEIDQE